MRIKVKFTQNDKPIPVNNQHIVNGYIHKCLGENNPYHDKPSDYCITNLRGGKLNSDKQTLNFVNGAEIIITSTNEEFMNNIIKGIMMNKSIGFGMNLNGIDFVEKEQLFDDYNIFRTLTPVLLKENGNFITVNDDVFKETLKKRMINKLSKIDPSLDLNGFDIIINKHKSNKTKLIKVKSVFNKVSQFDIIVKSNKKVAEIIYNYGIGQSTGSGFGSVYISKNHHLYYN